MIHKYTVQRADKDTERQIVYFRIPFIDEAQASQTRRIFRDIKLNKRNTKIIPTFVTGKPLSLLLRKDQKPECHHPCICNGTNLCARKNVVYRLTCRGCDAIYIGETHTSIHQRMKGKSQAKEHIEEVHGHQVTTSNFATYFKISIIASGFYDTTARKLAEEAHIRKEKPTLNSQLMT